MRRETEVLPVAAKRGFNLFMGKAACSTCHFAPVFNGTVPPRYLESETEVLELTLQEKQDIISFIKALTDTVATNSIPEKLPQFPTKSGLNSRSIGGRY